MPPFLSFACHFLIFSYISSVVFPYCLCNLAEVCLFVCLRDGVFCFHLTLKTTSWFVSLISTSLWECIVVLSWCMDNVKRRGKGVSHLIILVTSLMTWIPYTRQLPVRQAILLMSWRLNESNWYYKGICWS